MKQPKYFFLLLLCLNSLKGLAQFGSDTLLAQDNVLIPLPMVSINFGIGNLMSDVKLNNGPSPFKQFGYQLTITQPVTKFLNASFELYGGTVYGEEQRDLTNLNFKTSLFSQRLSIEYNFFPLLKPNAQGVQTIRPYVGFGVGLLSFRSKGDLKSSSGSYYNYWSDGLIYAETEGSVDATEATLLERDFVYETDLRDANLDGLRKYSQLTFSLPFNAGIRFQLTKNIGLNAAFAYVLNFSDMIDNVSVSGTGNRAGIAGNDNHLFGSIGLTIYLGTTKPSAKPKKATPEELAAAAKVKADAKRAEQKDAKEKALEAAKLATINADKNTNTASSDGVEISDNQVAVSTNSEPKITERNDTEVADVLANSNPSIAKSDSELNDKLGENSSDRKKLKESNLKGNGEESKAHVRVNSETTSNVPSTEGVLPKSENKSSETRTDSALNLESEDHATVQFQNDQKGTITELNSSVSKLNNGTEHAEITSSQTAKIAVPKVEISSSTPSSIDQNSLAENNSNSNNSRSETSAQETDELTTNELIVGTQGITAVDGISSANTPEGEIAMKAGRKEKNTSSTEKSGATTDFNLAVTKPKDSSTSSAIDKLEKSEPKKTGKFHWADLNDDGMISPTEVLHFIDQLFEGDSERTVEDIQFLIDYYFDQE